MIRPMLAKTIVAFVSLIIAPSAVAQDENSKLSAYLIEALTKLSAKADPKPVFTVKDGEVVVQNQLAPRKPSF